MKVRRKEIFNCRFALRKRSTKKVIVVLYPDGVFRFCICKDPMSVFNISNSYTIAYDD